MITLEKYNQKAHKPTEFHPDELRHKRIISCLGKKGVCHNPIVTFDLFDSVHFMKDTGITIHAIAYRGLEPTTLILER